MEIMIVVAIIGLLAAMALPNFVHARAVSQANACINNLRELDDAVNQMAMERGLQTGANFNFPNDILPYLRSFPVCPAGGGSTVVIGQIIVWCWVAAGKTAIHNWPG